MDGRKGGSGRVCLSVCLSVLYYYVISHSFFFLLRGGFAIGMMGVERCENGDYS
jgi:hypothetical protein